MDFSKITSGIKSKTKEIADSAKSGELTDSIKKGFGDFTAKAKEASEEYKKNMAEHKALTDEAKAPIEGAIVRYQVIYLGGFPKKPQKKSDSLALGFNIMTDRFIFKPEYLAKKEWFGEENFEVPFSQVTKFQIVKRQVSTAEFMMSSSGDTKSLEQENNIEITYLDSEGDEQVVRVEMLTGTTIYAQAAKCREMLDLLREKKILGLLNKNTDKNETTKDPDILGQLEKLSVLKEKGIITEEEFLSKKEELLAKM